MKRLILAAVLAAGAAALVGAQSEKLDYAMLGRIRDEGLSRSQVMDHISWLSDVYGPRLTGSPGIQQASEWAMKKFTEWGLANSHQETLAFGKGWSLVRFSAHLVEPQVAAAHRLPAFVVAGTKGAVTADVVRVQIADEADFDRTIAASWRARSSLDAAGANRADARRAGRPADDRQGSGRGRNDAGARAAAIERRRASSRPRRGAQRAAEFRLRLAEFY